MRARDSFTRSKGRVVLHLRFVSREGKKKGVGERERERERGRRRSVERVREVFEKLRGTLILDPAPLSENFPSDPCKKRCAEKEHLLEREREGARERFKAVETYRARNSRRKRLKAGTLKKRERERKRGGGEVNSKKGKSKQKVRFRKGRYFIGKKNSKKKRKEKKERKERLRSNRVTQSWGIRLK